MKETQANIQIDVDLTNPGQFFACCGLLELADRLCPGAEGWFEENVFHINAQLDLRTLIDPIANAKLVQLDPDDNTSSSINMIIGSNELVLDWWHDDRSGGKEMKVWAGTMESVRIAKAMQKTMKGEAFSNSNLLDVGLVVYDPVDPEKKVEPFYFDSRRAPNAHSRDIGFSPNDLQLTTTAFPAVEFLCLVGLQRCLPAKTSQARVYDYFSWTCPIDAALLQPVVTGCVRFPTSQCYRFENWYRTGQKKHKAFRPAIPLS